MIPSVLFMLPCKRQLHDVNIKNTFLYTSILFSILSKTLKIKELQASDFFRLNMGPY